MSYFSSFIGHFGISYCEFNLFIGRHFRQTFHFSLCFCCLLLTEGTLCVFVMVDICLVFSRLVHCVSLIVIMITAVDACRRATSVCRCLVNRGLQC